MKSKQFLMERKNLNQIIRPSCLGGVPKLPVIIMLTFVLSALVGCATHVADDDFTPTPVTFNIKVAYECGIPPPVNAIKMRDVVWDIITLDDEDFFTLTVDDYKALGMNTSDWVAASKEMKEQRNFYRDCIARSQQEIQNESMEND